MRESFAFIAAWWRDWLAGASTEEILRALDLIREELARRGLALTWTVEGKDFRVP